MKTAIIGAGEISWRHAKSLDELGVGIAGVFDVNAANAAALAKAYNSKVISDMSEVLDDIDMVHILTPPSARVDYVRQAAEAGKHIMMEKPAAIDIKDAEEMIAVTEKHKVKFMLDFNMRFRKGYHMLEEAVKSGRLGQINNVYVQRLGGGAGFGKNRQNKSWRTNKDLMCGMTIESVSHEIDMLLNLIPGIDRISACVFNSVEDLLPGYDNNSAISFSIKGGGIGCIHSSWSSYLTRSARGVIGTKGAAVIYGDDQWDFKEFEIKTEDMPFAETTHLNDIYSLTNHLSYLGSNGHFVDCVKNDKPTMITGKNGLSALIFARAALESSATGKAVAVNL